MISTFAFFVSVLELLLAQFWPNFLVEMPGQLPPKVAEQQFVELADSLTGR